MSGVPMSVLTAAMVQFPSMTTAFACAEDRSSVLDAKIEKGMIDKRREVEAQA